LTGSGTDRQPNNSLEPTPLRFAPSPLRADPGYAPWVCAEGCGAPMKRVVLTGMSGTGKSTLIRELAARGYKAIDTDYGGWSHWVNTRTGIPASPPPAGEYGWGELDWVWREDRIRNLLSTEDSDVLFLAGTAANQVEFHPQFDHILLLSAPIAVIAERFVTRRVTRMEPPRGAWLVSSIM